MNLQDQVAWVTCVFLILENLEAEGSGMHFLALLGDQASRTFYVLSGGRATTPAFNSNNIIWTPIFQPVVHHQVLEFFFFLFNLFCCLIWGFVFVFLF